MCVLVVLGLGAVTKWRDRGKKGGFDILCGFDMMASLTDAARFIGITDKSLWRIVFHYVREAMGVSI